jgi:TRAP-type C4-dicarboxylate transport system substrate-binding protein
MKTRWIGGVRIFIVVFLAVALAAAFSLRAEAARYKKEYKLTLNVGPTFYWGMGATKFAELVKEKTKGLTTAAPCSREHSWKRRRWWPRA